MGSSDSRREAMNSFEKVLARICLEHGWASRAQIADAVRARAQEGGTAALSALLVTRGVLTSEQAVVLQKEATEVTKSGPYADVREHDTWIGQLLVDSGAVSAEMIQAALDRQAAAAARKEPVPRIGEILIEKGVLAYSALVDALQRQSQLIHLACTACGKRYATDKKEKGKVYLCDECASPLASTPRLAVPEQASEPEEVVRAAANPLNVLGKYVLVSPLGKGAMGVVHKAWDRGLRRWVAIKVLLATSDPSLVLRFRREAEMAASIQHPNIVPIYDVGEEGGRPYIVMKFVEGSGLAGMSLSLEQSVSVTLQAARGVGHAHEREVVHRDIKPANIMIDSAGHVYVMDFGLAKDLYSNSSLTRPGTIMGTPSYMSPEQAAGNTDQVDRASDVYGLGAILYELVTGKPPFESDRVMETIRCVLEEPVIPPSKLRRETPAALETIILKALSKDKTKRYPNAGAFAKALEAVAGPVATDTSVPMPGASASAASSKRSPMKILFWAIILLVLSVLSGLGVLQLVRGGSPIPK
jgi:hypothetical protein